MTERIGNSYYVIGAWKDGTVSLTNLTHGRDKKRAQETKSWMMAGNFDDVTFHVCKWGDGFSSFVSIHDGTEFKPGQGFWTDRAWGAFWEAVNRQ